MTDSDDREKRIKKLAETSRLGQVLVYTFLVVGCLAFHSGPASSQEENSEPKRAVSLVSGTQEDSEKQLGYSSRHALIIGIDNYDDPAFPDLGYAAAHARGIAKLLVDHLKFEFDRLAEPLGFISELTANDLVPALQFAVD